jgi:hypothetical protein|nr:MAG: hypothetical protein DIU60_11160 [Actinomycetota bacterium]
MGFRHRLSRAAPLIAAASIVAANLPGGAEFAADAGSPEIAGWLPRPVDRALAGRALRALDAALPADGPWWVDPAGQVRAEEAMARLRRALGGRVAAADGVEAT